MRDRKALTELEQMVVDVLWEAGLKHLGAGIGRRMIKTRIGEEMLEQVLPYHHIIKNRRKSDQLEGMIFRNAPVVIMSWQNRLRGEFAFLLYDRRDRKLLAVRDRFGMKPLFYNNQGGRLLFASEVKAMMTTGLLPPHLSIEAVRNFFSTPGSIRRSSRLTDFFNGIDGPRGLHLCGNPGWDFLFSLPLEIVSFNAYAFGDTVSTCDSVKRFIEAGNIVSWDIVPTLTEEFTGGPRDLQSDECR
ncbi:MAG: hypothetical protein ABSC19_19730 [Syntrophorhabdales bacterium]|jgi:hypothetical protein